MAKKSKAPSSVQSSIVPLSVARRHARAQQRNDDNNLVRRHQNALHTIDTLDRGEVIRDLVSSRSPTTGAAPMATRNPEPECRPMATRQPSDRIPLMGLAMIVITVYAAIGSAIWLIVR